MRIHGLLYAAGLIATTVIVIGSLHRQPVQPSANWRAGFTAAASHLKFDSDRYPVPDDGVPRNAYPADAPKITIATAMTRDTGRVGHIESRITSDKPYPRLGIARGINYVWKDVSREGARQLIIPADTTYPVHWLRLAPHAHAPPPNGAPRLLVVRVDVPKTHNPNPPPPDSLPPHSTYALATCSNCTHWCIARDTLHTFSPVGPAVVEAIRAHFARNQLVLRRR